MKVLLDTNIILDYALERQPWFVESEQIFYFAEQKQIYEKYSKVLKVYAKKDTRA